MNADDVVDSGKDGDLETSPLMSSGQSVSVCSTPTTESRKSLFTAYYLTLKSFLGTGILFLPRAFTHAGLVYAVGLMLFMAFCTFISVSRLLAVARARNQWVYSEIAQSIGGKWISRLVKLCLILSQMGFCCAYLIFVAENVVSVLQTFGMTMSLDNILLYQLIIFIPLSLVQRLEFFSSTSGLANLLIMASIVYISYHNILSIKSSGVASGVYLFKSSFPLFIGTAVFSFEGVGMILPITRTLTSPDSYKSILFNSIIIVAFAYLLVGILSYLAFGEQTKTIILLNLPQNAATTTFQMLYSLSILLTFPVMAFPILSIACATFKSLENNIYLSSLIRVFVVLLLALVSYGGSKDLDKFVSLSGGLSCVPLTFIFPAWFSLKCNMPGKWMDRLFFVLGIILTISVTAINIVEMIL